ncbi:LuxR C-terminal-related transcriptional regulator [Zunongwangia sp. F363]|uniref:LuxR C-terminal-related transcriptional regulator n=1 Tax=Autumnicola tepida TaxID=3075595 RepID=A0ABU3CD63_9FLAO|nr:LuxR C-terminal-related transcriptional regulator [Zunongwangia sp. F363]MDT0644270.1 LuxR C-terminal-related transcriptional regulator [Zunongwangia sp. F363]
MNEKKHLLLISTSQKFIREIKEALSLQFEISEATSVHAGYGVAISLLPDVIIIDKTSFSCPSDLKNITNYKSTHFLAKSWLFLFVGELEKQEMEDNFANIVDEVISESTSINALCEKVINRIYVKSSLSNYWKDCFMGMFNLMVKPVVLLEGNTILAMNDAFKKTFKVKAAENVRLTDFVNVENKAKVQASLRNFSRGKHLKAVTKTNLLLQNDKVREAKISFSKLSNGLGDQFVMMIDFSGEEVFLYEEVGTASAKVEESFTSTSTQCDFSFTKREKEIIELLCKGYKTKEISSTLFISPKTIEKHRSNIIKRTKSDTILESIIYAINHNLVEINA